MPDWDKLKKDYADTPNVVIGLLDCSASAKRVCDKYRVNGYPSIGMILDGKLSYFNGGRDYSSMKREVEVKLDPRRPCRLKSKKDCEPAELKILGESEKMSRPMRSAKMMEMEEEIGDLRKQSVDESDPEKQTKAIKLAEDLEVIKAGGAVEKVEQLLNDAEWKAHCQGRVCVVAFLPHIFNDSANGRNAQIKALDDAMKASKKDGMNIGFLWSQGGDQSELEDKLGLQSDFPVVIAVNFKKIKFAVLRGKSGQARIFQFLSSLSRGSVKLTPLPAGLAAVDAVPWDGKDAFPPVEKEL